MRDDPSNLLLGSVGGILAGGAQLGDEQMPAGEDVLRQVAIAVIVTVKVPNLLLAVDGIVRSVQVNDHARGSFTVGTSRQSVANSAAMVASSYVFL